MIKLSVLLLKIKIKVKKIIKKTGIIEFFLSLD